MMEKRMTFDIELSEPVMDVDGELVSKISLRKPKGKHLLVFDRFEGEIEATLELVAILGGLPATSVHNMDIDDVMQCMEWLKLFFPELQKDGKKSSQTPPTPSTSNPPTSGK